MTKRTIMAIFTLNGYFNYGNRLQLFALARILRSLGGKSMVYWPKNINTRLKEFLKYNTPLSFYYEKEVKIKRFTEKFTPEVSNRSKIDYSIIGSDQVWNPNYLRMRPYLLNVPNGRIKISYAASIGTESLTSNQLDMYKEALKQFKAISVREQSAKELLQPLTDKRIEVVLDPTLLLDKSEYESLEQRPNNIEKDEKYILCYILGGKEQKNIIYEYAIRHGYRVIMFSDKEGSSYGIEEFLYLVHHAQLICTDSFHACVFSFIFERPFIAFRRTGEADYMYTRLQSFMDVFKLRNREFNGKNITKQNVDVDYTEGKKVLQKEREKSLNFLKTALEVDDECQ